MVDRVRAARAIEEFLRALGHEPTGELAETGERVADAWADDILEGEVLDPVALLHEGSIAIEPATGHGAALNLVVLRDLSVSTMCPHHLLPAWGKATVIYLPNDRIAGIGTIAHVLDALSRRLTLQERIGADMVELLSHELGVRGALCKLSLTHTCLVARGERKSEALVDTLSVSGAFAVASGERDLALAALSSRGA